MTVHDEYAVMQHVGLPPVFCGHTWIDTLIQLARRRRRLFHSLATSSSDSHRLSWPIGDSVGSFEVQYGPRPRTEVGLKSFIR